MTTTPWIAATAVFVTLVLGNLYLGTLEHTSAQHHSKPPAAGQLTPQDNPVLAALRAATAGNTSSRALANSRDAAAHNKSCCRIGPMQGVLAAPAAFQKAARSLEAAGSMQEARRITMAARPHLAKPWAEALQAVVAANTQTGNSSCQCRSVEVLPAAHDRPRGSNSSTAILLVINSWARLMQHSIPIYSANLLMLWFYARTHGYGLHIYVHGVDLPPWMPVYFIKPAGLLHMMDDLHYQHVMYCDWDVLLSPHTAPPLSLFYSEYPKAGLLFQGEYNLGAGANLWRNTPDGRAFLQAWWDLGAQGCCPTAQHDQSALKHIVAAYLANFTGEASLYGRRAQHRFKLPAKLPPPLASSPGSGPFAVHSTEPPSTPASKWMQLRPLLQERGTAVGMVGLDVHYPRHPGMGPAKLAFVNCMGMWWGCIPPDSPALLYHTGGGKMVSKQLA